MAYRINGILDINFQGLNLNCGRYCLEAVMRWKHGSAFGKAVTAAAAWNPANNRHEATYGAVRTAHSAAAQAHIDTPLKVGFDPGNYTADYGLVPLAKPQSAAQWEAALRTYGPLIVAGHIGAVRIIPLRAAGHFIVVIGVNASNEIEYYDPLRPWHALGGEPTTMSSAEFDQLTYDDVYAAAV